MRLILLLLTMTPLLVASGDRQLRFGNVSAQEAVTPTTTGTGGAVSVTGWGSVKAPPDMAIVTTTVSTLAWTAADSIAKNNDEMNAVRDIVKAAPYSVAPADLQTTGFSVSPENKWDETTRTAVFVGYRVLHSLTIKVLNLDVLGGLLDAVGSKSNQLSGIHFGIADTTAMVDEARRNAMQDAMLRARVYTEEAGVALGPVLTISEAGAIKLPSYGGDRGPEFVSPVPVEVGEQEITASINVVYQLGA